ncbi:hypothetical protein ACOSQ2_017488 [Xanthoceras sorbifolium]
MSNPSSWAGFNEQRKAILVCDEDTVITEGQFGPSMTIAPELKAQLCKPWEKEAKVNNESNVEIIPNSENLYGPWLYTSFNRGGFRPVNRNQDVTGNATNVGMSAAKSRGVKNQKTNDKDSVLSKDGQYQRRNEVNDVNGNGSRFDVLVDEDSEDVDSIGSKIQSKAKGKGVVTGLKVLTEISNTLDIGSKHGNSLEIPTSLRSKALAKGKQNKVDDAANPLVLMTEAYCLGIIKEARKKTERRNKLRSLAKRPVPKTSMRWWRRIVPKTMKRRLRIQESYNNYIRTL